MLLFRHSDLPDVVVRRGSIYSFFCGALDSEKRRNSKVWKLGSIVASPSSVVAERKAKWPVLTFGFGGSERLL